MISNFVPLTISEVRRETPDAISVTLAVPESQRATFDFRPGQHVAVRATLDGEEVRRTYSICSGVGAPTLQIAIKRIPDGRFSAWANATLAPGMTLDVMPPAGRFILPPSDGIPRHVLAVAAGAGITPILAILQAALDAEADTRCTLIYGNRDLEHSLFRQVLEDLKDRHLGRLTLFHVLSRGDADDATLLQGRITGEKVIALMRQIGPTGQIAHAFLCGPGSLIKDCRDTLLGLGLPRERVHHEFFAPAGGAARSRAPSLAQAAAAPLPVGPTAADSTEVVIVLDGVRHRLELRRGEPVLEAALRARLRVPYSCRGGMCCTCRAKIVEGQADMLVNYSLEAWEMQKGFTLTCQAVARSDRLVIDYDQM